MEATTAALPTPVTTQGSDQSVAIRGNHEQVERITYLASLVSRFEDVDPMLDTLRNVTANWDGAMPLAPQDVNKLQDLERDLKNYLITKDQVRAFTAESLEQQLKARFEDGGVRKRGYLSLLWVLGSSLVVAGIPFALPPSLLSQEGRLLLAIPLFFVALHIGISWLFLSALKNFQQEVRKAFQLICVGVVLFGAVFSHYAAISAFHLDSHPLFSGGGFTWLVILPYVFILAGLRIYARQIGVKSRILSVWFVLAILAAATTLVIVESLTLLKDPDNYISVFLSIGGRLLEPLTAMGVILAWKIHKVVAVAYARPMKWLFVYLLLAFISSALATILFIVGTYGGGIGDGGGNLNESMPFYIFMALAGVPSQLILLWTGYSFKKELSK